MEYMKKDYEIEVRFLGKGGHSSRPEEADNPLDAGFRLIRFIEKNRGVLDAAPVFFEAGTAQNIIPDQGKALFFACGDIGPVTELFREGAKEILEKDNVRCVIDVRQA